MYSPSRNTGSSPDTRFVPVTPDPHSLLFDNWWFLKADPAMTGSSPGAKVSYMLTDITRPLIYHTIEEIVEVVLFDLNLFSPFSIVYRC